MTEIEHPRASPFFSLFRSKKKVNEQELVDKPQRSTSFTDRVKSKKEKKELASTLPTKRKEKSQPPPQKSRSFETLVEEDPVILVESLQTIADEQPLVARSIPKHAKIRNEPKDPLRDCLFEQEVYDTMLSDSLKVCDLLASHLDDCITHVRAKSPEACRMNLSDASDCHDSGRGLSSASSTISTSPTTRKRTLKSCIRTEL